MLLNLKIILLEYQSLNLIKMVLNLIKMVLIRINFIIIAVIILPMNLVTCSVTERSFEGLQERNKAIRSGSLQRVITLLQSACLHDVRKSWFFCVGLTENGFLKYMLTCKSDWILTPHFLFPMCKKASQAKIHSVLWESVWHPMCLRNSSPL